MDYRELGRTGIKVSSLCLGTMTWGEQNSEAQAHEQMDYALDQGINFFDAAELYPIPPKRETQGRTEAHVGSWFKSRKARDRVILASKVVGRTKNTWFREDGSQGRLAPAQIREALESSLRRLKTDYIDLYQVHWPDRPMKFIGTLEYLAEEGDAHPIAETLGVLCEFMDQGKVRAIGISNETPWGAMTYLKEAKARGLQRIASIQNAYSLVNRKFEVGLSEITYHEGVGLLAYSPLAQGYLTGKYENGALPKGSRMALFGRASRYKSLQGLTAISAYVALARKHGIDPAQMALQFVASRPFVTSAIFGATTMDQLRTDVASIDQDLSRDLLDGIEVIHRKYTNPCP